MLSYLNVHETLEQRRRAAKEAGTSGRTGPRTIVRPWHDSFISLNSHRPDMDRRLPHNSLHTQAFAQDM